MDKLLTTKEVGEYLGLSEKTLANSRCSGVGICIDFIKLGASVRYRKSDLDKYVKEHIFKHTSEVRNPEA